MRRTRGHYENEVLLSLWLPDVGRSLFWTSHEDWDENGCGAPVDARQFQRSHPYVGADRTMKTTLVSPVIGRRWPMVSLIGGRI